MFARVSPDSRFAVTFNREVEKHMKTFLHREKKKVRTLNSVQFTIIIETTWTSFQLTVCLMTLFCWLSCSCLLFLTGLVGVPGMLFIPMSQQRVLKKALRGK